MTSNSPRLAGVFAFVITLFLCCLPAIAFAQDPSDDSPGLPILELAPKSLALAATDAITSPLTVHAIVRNPITESVDIRLFTIVNAGAVVSPTESTREGVQPDSDVSIPFEISADPDGVAGGSVVFVVEITSSGVSSVTTIATAHLEITPTAPSKPAAPEAALFSVTLQSDKQLARGRVEDAFLLLKNESAKSTMIIAAEPTAHGVFTLEPGLSLEGKPVPPASTILVPIRISTAESVLFDVYPFGLEIAFTAQDAPASTKRIASVFENLTVYDRRLKSVALFLDVFSLPSQMTLPFLLGLWSVFVFALLQALWQWNRSRRQRQLESTLLETAKAAVAAAAAAAATDTTGMVSKAGEQKGIEAGMGVLNQSAAFDAKGIPVPPGLALGAFLIALFGFVVLILFSFATSLFGSTFLSFDGLYGGPPGAKQLALALGIGAIIALVASVLYNLVFKNLLAGVIAYLCKQLEK